MKLDLSNKKKIVIKVGSSLLVLEDKLRKKWLETLASDISELVKQNFQIIIVSSGSVALGKDFFKLDHKNKISLEEKQAAAAIGQIYLMSAYRNCFKKLDIDVAQILLTLADCNSRNRYVNARNVINTLLQNNIIPIINENDSVAVDEIKIGDNDRLAARVSQMVSSDILLLFSDIDGLYDKNPREHKDAKFIPEVRKITNKIENMASGSDSEVGTGGMVTKIEAAKIAASSACDTIVADGKKKGSLGNLILGKKKFTIFYGKKKSLKSREKWLSGFMNVNGGVVVDKCAKEALLRGGNSLLPVGVIGVGGDFKEGDAIFIKDEDGNHIASGISNYDICDVKKVLEKNSTEVRRILKKSNKLELVHIHDLAII